MGSGFSRTSGRADQRSQYVPYGTNVTSPTIQSNAALNTTAHALKTSGPQDLRTFLSSRKYLPSASCQVGMVTPAAASFRFESAQYCGRAARSVTSATRSTSSFGVTPS